jgi:hypothetical protein
MLASSLRRTPERRSKQALAHVQRQLRTTLSTLRPDRVLHARTHARGVLSLEVYQDVWAVS